MQTIPVFKPSVSEKEISAVTEVLKSGWWGEGPKVKEFEEKFSRFIGKKYAVGLNSCTAALHLAGQLLNLQPGDEVITTPMTFISTAYLATYHGAHIVFADVEPETLNMDPEDVRKKITSRTKVIVPVHYGGHACRMEELMNLARQYKLKVVEDCAHATGGYYKNKVLGSFGDMSVFSFHAVKNLAMGDGGMLLTNNVRQYERARRARWVGIDKDTAERVHPGGYSWEYQVHRPGFKFQMTDIAAALGLAQLDRLQALNKQRRIIAKAYDKALASISWIETPVEKKYARSAYHNYVIKVGVDRNKLIGYLKSLGISTGVHYMPLYLHPVYADVDVDCPIADEVYKKILTLPLFPDLPNSDFARIIDALKEFKA